MQFVWGRNIIIVSALHSMAGLLIRFVFIYAVFFMLVNYVVFVPKKKGCVRIYIRLEES